MVRREREGGNLAYFVIFEMKNTFRVSLGPTTSKLNRWNQFQVVSGGCDT